MLCPLVVLSSATMVTTVCLLPWHPVPPIDKCWAPTNRYQLIRWVFITGNSHVNFHLKLLPSHNCKYKGEIDSQLEVSVLRYQIVGSVKELTFNWRSSFVETRNNLGRSAHGNEKSRWVFMEFSALHNSCKSVAFITTVWAVLHLRCSSHSVILKAS